MSSTLTPVLVAIGVIVVAAVVAWQGLRAYARRFLRKAMEHTPSFQVQALEAPAGVTRVRLCLGGTDQEMDLVSLSAPKAGARDLDLAPPNGFFEAERQEESELEWRPLEPLAVRPGEPLEMEFRWNPAAERVVRIFGHVEAGRGLGGIGTAFAVLAGPRPPLEVRASNLRSAIYARARERGVVPRELPEWRELEEVEARLASEEENEGHPTA